MTPCKGYSPFHVATMRSLCATGGPGGSVCPHTAACRQSAADAPFPFVEAQVWGGLVLPAQQGELPPPTQQKRYAPEPRVHERTPENRNGSGRPPWWHHIGRNLDPDLV